MSSQTPMILLRIPDNRLEEEWRRDFNSTHWRGDIYWYAGLILWTLSIYRRWGGDRIDLAIWLTINLTSCLFPLAMLAASPATYRTRRLSVLVATRLMRVVGVFFLITPNQNAIWQSASDASCFLLAQYFKLAYLVCQSLAHAVPLKHHVGMMVLNTVTTLRSVPPRCVFDCATSPVLGAGAVQWLTKLRAVLDPAWIISIVTKDQPTVDLDPEKACIVVQSWFMLVLGVVLPLLCFATVEEGWKARFLANRGYPRVTPPVAVAIAYDLVVAAATSVVTLQAVVLFLPQ